MPPLVSDSAMQGKNPARAPGSARVYEVVMCRAAKK